MMAEQNDNNKTIQIAQGHYAKLLTSSFACTPQADIAGAGECVLIEDPEQLVSVCRTLKDDHDFETLALINAVEYLEHLQLIYQLWKIHHNNIEILHCKLNLSKEYMQSSSTGLYEAPSLTGVWESANWFEREIYDMQGVLFVGHPALERILNPSDWEGYPLRKDYIPPFDALNAPISAVKSVTPLPQSTRQEVEQITTSSWPQ